MTDLLRDLRACLPLIDTIQQACDERLANPDHRVEYPEYPALAENHIRAHCHSNRSWFVDVPVPADQCERLRDYVWYFTTPGVIFRFTGRVERGQLIRERVTLEDTCTELRV